MRPSDKLSGKRFIVFQFLNGLPSARGFEPLIGRTACTLIQRSLDPRIPARRAQRTILEAARLYKCGKPIEPGETRPPAQFLASSFKPRWLRGRARCAARLGGGIERTPWCARQRAGPYARPLHNPALAACRRAPG